MPVPFVPVFEPVLPFVPVFEPVLPFVPVFETVLPFEIVLAALGLLLMDVEAGLSRVTSADAGVLEGRDSTATITGIVRTRARHSP